MMKNVPSGLTKKKITGTGKTLTDKKKLHRVGNQGKVRNKGKTLGSGNKSTAPMSSQDSTIWSAAFWLTCLAKRSLLKPSCLIYFNNQTHSTRSSSA
jgi:hypothetical protein